MNPIRPVSRLRRLALALLLGLSAGAALAEPPSDADVNRLLSASRAQSMIDGMLPQMEAMQQKQFEEAFRGRQVTAAEADQLRRIQERSRQTLRDVLSWSKLRPLYVDLYKQSFSKQDVLAMAEFYESPAGQSLLDKTPTLMQNVMIALQKMLQPAMADLDRDLDRIIHESSPAPKDGPVFDVPPSPPAR